VYETRRSPDQGVSLAEVLYRNPEFKCRGCTEWHQGTMKIDPHHAMRMFWHLLESLCLLRLAGVEHTDVSPGNLLVNLTEAERKSGIISTSLPRLIDFGHAKLGGDWKDPRRAEWLRAVMADRPELYAAETMGGAAATETKAPPPLPLPSEADLVEAVQGLFVACIHTNRRLDKEPCWLAQALSEAPPQEFEQRIARVVKAKTISELFACFASLNPPKEFLECEACVREQTCCNECVLEAGSSWPRSCTVCKAKGLVPMMHVKLCAACISTTLKIATDEDVADPDNECIVCCERSSARILPADLMCNKGKVPLCVFHGVTLRDVDVRA
jgi:serine/threonine protein kinase